MVLITPLRMGPIQCYRHFLYIINEKQPTFKYAIEGRLFFSCSKVCIIKDYSYLCSTRTRQASQRCSNVRVVFVYIRFFSKYANGKIHLSGYRV